MAAERAEILQPQLERVGLDLAEQVGEIAGHAALDVASEPQGDVEVIVVDPLRARQRLSEIGQSILDLLGQLDTGEQSGHG